MKVVNKILKDIFKIQDKRQFIKVNLPYLVFFYLGDIFSKHIGSYVGGDILDRVFQGILDIGSMSYIPSINIRDLLIAFSFASLVKIIVYTKGKNKKKFRQSIEYGSARWGNKKDIEPYMDEVFENNIILTETERIIMNSRPKEPKYARNKNVLVIGALVVLRRDFLLNQT